MGTAVLPARRRLGVSAWTVAPSAVALAFGVLYLVLEPRPGDLAAPALFLPAAFPVGGWAPPYRFAAGGCVDRAGGWTRVIADEGGFMRLSARSAPERIVDHDRRRDDG